MTTVRRNIFMIAALILALVIFISFQTKTDSTVVAASTPTTVISPTTTQTPARKPVTIPIADGDLKDAVLAAGDYLVREQLPNGELSYQVDF